MGVLLRITLLMLLPLLLLTTVFAGVALSLGMLTPADIIVYASEQEDGTTDLFIMDVNRELSYQLTSHPGQNTLPAWSLDGRQIAYVSDESGVQNVHLIRPDGRGKRQLTNMSQGQFFYSLAWAPDNEQIAIRANRGAHEQIFVADPETGDYDLVFTRFSVQMSTIVSWSPDARYITFNLQGEGAQNYENVFVVAAEAEGEVEQLTDDEAFDFSPQWSPDGEQIAFVSYRDGSRDVFTMDITGRSVMNLTRMAGSDTSPVWSPDGQQIAFMSDRSGNWDVYVMSRDGEQVAALNVGHRMFPLWSPSGHALLAYWPRRSNDPSQVVVVDPEDPTAHQVLQIDRLVSPPSWRP